MLKNTIITDIKDEAQHKRVQEKLFEMGCEWIHSGKNTSVHLTEKRITIDSNSKMWNDGEPDIPDYKHINASEFLGEEVPTELKGESDKKTMTEIKINGSSIVNFFNDLTVSEEDKELRKAGLKDIWFNWTKEAEAVILTLEAKERGYKSFSELNTKVGREKFTSLELDTIYKKFYDKLLETAKAFNKEQSKKKE